ncbi:hypothetical protein Hanom_Chr10g00882561 [Helianthus anomalus]
MIPLMEFSVTIWIVNELGATFGDFGEENTCLIISLCALIFMNIETFVIMLFQAMSG